MYAPLLFAHSWLRWIIVLLAVAAIISAAGKRGNGAWSKSDDRLSLWLTLTVDIQIVLGLILYFVATPHFSRLLHGGASIMSDRIARYWAVEHVVGMIIAIALVHVGRKKVKNSPQSDRARLTFKFIGLALLVMLLSLPWPFMPYARPLFRLG
jgi:hypothetical protein